MSGMGGLSKSSIMSMNCNMKNMHGNDASNQIQTSTNRSIKQKNDQNNKIPNDVLGNNLDVKI